MTGAATKKREWRKADGSLLPSDREAATEAETADLFDGVAAQAGDGPNAATFIHAGNRGDEFSLFAQDDAGTPAERAMQFMQGLRIPEGPNAGKPIELAPFQRQFIEGAMAEDTAAAILSIGRGNGKSAITAGLALGGLMGVWDRQPRREIIAAARTRDQGRIIWDFVAGFAATLPLELQRRLIYRRAPRLEIEFEGDGGGHVLRVIAADGKSALGGAPTMAILDERGHWALDRGDELEHALLSGLGKRGGRAFLISTSASDDTHPFSRWIDDPAPGSYVQEHRPAPGLPADDRESLLIANPGAPHGIGGSLEWLEAQAKRAIARGGSSLTSFRLYNRNERVGAQMISIDAGAVEWPVTTSAVTAGWADGETANVAGPTTYATTDRAMSPDHNLGIQMRITRKTLKQSGAALEQAVRRDMSGAMGAAMDQAAFLGTGANGQPLGVITGAATYGITSTAVDALASWGAFRSAVTRFMTANAAGSPDAVRALIRPELWDYLDSALISGTAVSEWDRLVKNLPSANIAMTNNALAAPSGTPSATSALLTTAAGGVAPLFVGAWGAVDMIRDPYTDAQSGGLRITALATMDVTVARPAQLELLTGLELEAA